MARAFIDSQSADAHAHLFHRIFEIVECDTGFLLQFLHINDHGIHSITVDAHKGQALGKSVSIVVAVTNLNGQYRQGLEIFLSHLPDVYKNLLPVRTTSISQLPHSRRPSAADLDYLRISLQTRDHKD